MFHKYVDVGEFSYRDKILRVWRLGSLKDYFLPSPECFNNFENYVNSITSDDYIEFVCGPEVDVKKEDAVIFRIGSNNHNICPTEQCIYTWLAELKNKLNPKKIILEEIDKETLITLYES